MGKSGIKISNEEAEKIMECHMKGLTPREMSAAVGRSANAIYLHLKSQGVRFIRPCNANKPEGFPLAEELDFSQFPDTVIFKHDRTFIF